MLKKTHAKQYLSAIHFADGIHMNSKNGILLRARMAAAYFGNIGIVQELVVDGTGPELKDKSEKDIIYIAQKPKIKN